MIPSESCILPEALSTGNGSKPCRRTIFSSALEGSWTGVGHREMVWCHQVRWRIARAALQLATASTASGRAIVLDTWLRDGQTLPPEYKPAMTPLALEGTEYLSPNVRLELRNPTGSRTYLVPAPGDTASGRRFLLYVSQGSIPPTAPHNPLPLRASIYACGTANTCQPLHADSLRLVPNPQPGRPFPMPDEGSEESEGVVVFEAVLPSDCSSVAVRTEYGDGRGWVIGDFVPEETSVDSAGALGPYFYLQPR